MTVMKKGLKGGADMTPSHGDTSNEVPDLIDCVRLVPQGVEESIDVVGEYVEVNPV
jgi:hypothetical protein